MSQCDLHVHTIRSSCGLHTLLEVAAIMREKGFEAFAVTDHGPALDTPRSYFSVMLRRLPSVIAGVRIFKGIEASIMDIDGSLDCPVWEGVPSYEAVLAGLHPHDAFSKNTGIEVNTRAVVQAMRKHPAIKILTHPYFALLPLDLDAVTDVAAETETALEINNSYLLNDKANPDRLALMLELAKSKGNLLAVNSDGHVFNEIGEFGLAFEFMEPFGIAPGMIVNRSFESTLSFLGLDG